MKFSSLLEKLLKKDDLTAEEAETAMKGIMEKKFTDSQTGAFLAGLQAKGVAAEELSAFVKVLQSFAVKINVNAMPLIDTCGTGGDLSSTFNISTTAAFVLAGCGVKVAKHGNRSVSSACGSADLLTALGVAISLTPAQVKQCIEQAGIGFLFAPIYHPAFKNVANIRKELGIKTVFNLLGPLLNPANVSGQVIGVYDPELTELFADVLKNKGIKHALVVHGNGLDELSLSGKNKITELKEGKIKTYYVSAADIGLKECSADNLKGGSVEKNAEIFLSILKGEQSPRRDIVLFNAAAGIIVAGKAHGFLEGIELAKKSIDNGNALRIFEKFKEKSNDFAENS